MTMFCRNCGKPTENPDGICNECMNPVSVTESQPICEPTVVQETFTAEEPLILATPESVTQRSSRKWLLITLCVLGALALAAALLFAFGVFGDEDDFDDYEEEILTFDSPQDQFEYLVRNAFASGSEGGNYEELNKVEAHLLLGDTVQDLLTEEIGISAEWIEDIRIVSKTGRFGNMTAMEYGIGLGKTNILTLGVFIDTVLQGEWIGIPELSDTYLFMDLSEIMAEGGQGMLSLFGGANSVVPSLDQEEWDEFADKCLDILLEGLGQVTGSEETVTVDGISQTCTKLSVSVAEAKACDIILNILNELKSDEAVFGYLQELTSAFYGEFGDFENWTDEFIFGVTELKAFCGSQDYISIEVYVDDRNHVIGCTMVDSSNMRIHWQEATADGKFAFEADIAEEILVEGSGSDKNNKVNGTYDVTVDGEKCLTVKVKDITSHKRKGTSSGTVQLIPGAEYVNDLIEEITGVGYPADIALEVKWDTKKDSAFVSVKVFMSDALLMGITLELSESETEISVPKESLDMLNDPDGIQNWLLELDFAKLIKNMEKAGVPASVTNQLKQITDLLPLYLAGM